MPAGLGARPDDGSAGGHRLARPGLQRRPPGLRCERETRAAAPFPTWFRPFAQHEQDATALRTFEHSLVPGLLQIPEDARALLSTRMGTSQDETEQLDHLVEMAQRTSVLIEVVPLDVGAHEGVNGAFVIADFADTPSIVYLETALTGLVVERPEDVAAVTLSYETLRAEALSRSGSLDKLKEVQQTWT
jgi:hypothetical protein